MNEPGERGERNEFDDLAEAHMQIATMAQAVAEAVRQTGITWTEAGAGMQDFVNAGVEALSMIVESMDMLYANRLPEPTRWQRFCWWLQDFWLERKWG